jgi:hypothetical protein
MRRLPRHYSLIRAAAAAVVLLPAAEVLGCPNCTTASYVRAAVFDGSFWMNLILIALPLIILGVISTLLYQIDIDI